MYERGGETDSTITGQFGDNEHDNVHLVQDAGRPMPSRNSIDALLDHDAVLALIVNSGFYRHQNLRKSLYTIFCEHGDERDWDSLTSTAWDVLYFLIENYIRNEKTSVMDIPHAVGLSASTARRMLRKLEHFGMAVTHMDATDKRRVISELSQDYHSVVDTFIDGYSNGFAALIQQHDMNERHTAQQALDRTREELMASEALLIQAQKMAALGHWVWNDVDKSYDSVSEENARIHGLSLKGFLGKGQISYFDDRFIHPDDVENYRAQVLEADQNLRGYDVRHRIITANGDLRYVREISHPVFNENGKLVRSIGTTQDITEYVEVEMALRESELRYRRLLDQSSDLMAVCKANGARIFVNKAYCVFTGKSEQELLKGKAGDTYSPRYFKEFNASLHALTPKNPTVEREYPMVRHDGEQRILLWIDHGRFDEKGMLIEAHATGREISD